MLGLPAISQLNIVNVVLTVHMHCMGHSELLGHSGQHVVERAKCKQINIAPHTVLIVHMSGRRGNQSASQQHNQLYSFGLSSHFRYNVCLKMKTTNAEIGM